MSDPSIDHWYPVGLLSDINAPRQTLLFGQEISLTKEDTGFSVKTSGGASLPTIKRFGHLWTSLVQPDHDLFAILEADTPGRHLVDVGSVKVKCSPLRAVENFLDIAHFPFIHTDILGAEPHTEVDRYKVEIRE